MAGLIEDARDELVAFETIKARVDNWGVSVVWFTDATRTELWLQLAADTHNSNERHQEQDD